MGHYVHHNTLGIFWTGYRDGEYLEIDELLKEIVEAAAFEGFQEFVHTTPGYGGCIMFTILGSGQKSGRPLDLAYGRAAQYLRRFAAPGEKWSNVQWVEVCVYSEFTDADAPKISRTGNYKDGKDVY